MIRWIVFLFFLNIIDCDQNLIKYRHVPDYNSKKCASPDMVFEHQTLTDVVCAFKCLHNEDCVGVFYSESTKSCTGCGHFHVVSLQDTAEDTKYFYNCGEINSWAQFKDSYYKLFAFKAEYGVAKSYCRDNLCSVMAHIDSESESDFISTMARDGNVEKFLLGLEYITADLEWKWGDDHSIPTYTNWRFNEPNGAPNETCAISNVNYEYRWQAIICQPFPFICEKKTA